MVKGGGIFGPGWSKLKGLKNQSEREIFGSSPKRIALNAKEEYRIWIRDGKKCRLCNKYIPFDSEDKRYDHFKALSNRGSNNPDNRFILCKDCNDEKHDKTPNQLEKFYLAKINNGETVYRIKYANLKRLENK